MSSCIRKIYDESSWVEYEKQLKNIIDKYLKDSIANEHLLDVTKNANEFNQAKNNYKRKFNKSKYYLIASLLPFSVLTVVFAYWNIKTFKTMSATKKKLLKEYEKQNSERIESIIKAASSINFYKIYEECMQFIKYDHQGPIPGGFIKRLNQDVVFETDMLEENRNKNAYISSWGCFDKNSVILNIANKNHWIGKKNYSMTATYPYTVRTSNGTSTSYETLTANYQHDFPEYSKQFNVAVFSSTCEGLEFRTKLEKTGISKIFKKDKRPQLDSVAFEKIFDIERNDEAMVRMFFTVDLQEYLTEQVGKNKKHILPSYLKYMKKGPLYYSGYIINKPINSRNNFDLSILNNEDMTLDTFLLKCRDTICNLVKQRFLSLNIATAVPLIVTEDKTILARNLKNLYKQTAIFPEDKVYAQYVFNAIWENEFLVSDTDVMNTISIESKQIVGSTILSAAIINSYGYIAKNMTKPVLVSGCSGTHTIMVPYVDYKETRDNALFFYAKIERPEFYENGNSDFDNDVINFIRSLELPKLKIKEKHIACISDNQSDYNKIVKLIQFIDKKYKK
ncbi:MAG: hypothetical protein ACRC4L_02285 [Mycoplasma sp.]